tara:strand:+ start:3318 stop:3569 length:252 start_codon:yes stop_codon:yes gene_type:complete
MMNYIVCEPGEWSVMRIVHDLGGGSEIKRIYRTTLKRLRSRGLVTIGKKDDSDKDQLTTEQLKKKLMPTSRGIESFKSVGCTR